MRYRRLLLFATVAITSIAGVIVAALFPLEGALSGTYAAIAPQREFLWAFLIGSAANLVLAVCSLAVVGWLLTPERGATWATVGGALMWLGAAFYSTGVATWAGITYFGTDPQAINTATGTQLFEAMSADFGHLFGPALAGGLVVTMGTIVLSVGVWRAATTPRWIPPTLAAATAAIVVVGASDVLGLLAEAVGAFAATSMAWYVVRPLQRQPSSGAT